MESLEGGQMPVLFLLGGDWMRWRRIAIAGLVLVLLMTMVASPKRADAFLPALVIPVVGGMELATTVFTGLATLAAGIWLTFGKPITQEQSEKLAKHFEDKWDDDKYQAMRKRIFSDAITWGTNTTTVTVEPEIVDGVNVTEYERYAEYFFSTSFYAGRSGYYYFGRDDPYGFRVNGRVYKGLDFGFDGNEILKLKAYPSFVSMDSVSFSLDKDVVALLYKIDNEVDFFHAIQKYVPVVDASTMAPVVPNYQDVYPKITNPDRPRDIAVPTGMFKVYPKDIYGQVDVPELTYRPKTKDYISNDGLVYPAADVVVTIPVPRVNDKGDVGVATPAGDWVDVRPGNPVVPDVVNPDIPGAGAPVIPGVGNLAIPGVANPAVPDAGVGSPAIPGVVNPAIPGVANPAIPAIPELTETTTSERINWEPLRLAAGALTRKFPFSLPWDLKRQLDVFDVAPQAPKFVVDKTLMVLAGHTIPLKMTIDLSHFDLVAAITRWFLVIAFDVGVILSMRRFMPE
jgi:hypothetical protein